MSIIPYKSLITLGLLAVSLLPVTAAEPNADELLRAMSTKLAAAQSFSFDATREIDAALLEGRNVAEKARITAAVQRPSKLAAQAKSKLGVRRFIADGKTATLFDAKTNHYASVPMPATLDGLVAKLDEKYGFTPPLAEFALSDPYADLRRQAESVTYLGLGKTTGGFLGLGGVECHRLALKGKDADAELWIAVSDQLPRKLVATFHLEGQPQVRINFTKWNLNAPVTASSFTFTPPEGAEKIEMLSTDKMQALTKASSKKS
ncbi:MAG: hypothetical protein RL693_1683 [Verrucomicrobiota bacterium]|jgi:hypothetical protein